MSPIRTIELPTETPVAQHSFSGLVGLTLNTMEAKDGR